ncbi:PP2C family protein-serine/threonine phosphatase [Streptomyces sp. NPDC059009]|uniref:PP2C family protein-serine/threonine phosphatase n=1 Tax=Streptomyces sp. NPDC059009 TaxID=3346694 RepID=UPI003689632B
MPKGSSTVWLWLTALIGAGLAALDLAMGPATSLIGLLLVCPMVASAQQGGRVTATVSAATLALAVGVSAAEHDLGRGDTPVRLLILAVASAYATGVARRSTRHQRQLKRIAAVAERAIIRPTDFRIAGLEVSARYRSAAPQAHIGGDLYAFANTPMGLRLLIGDVRGKGLSTVHLSAAAIGHFRDAAYTQPDLLDVVRELDGRLAGDLGPEDFITVLIAEVAPDHVRLVNCGHHPPLLVPGTGAPTLLVPPLSATPIGLGPAPVVHEAPLTDGDRLLFYTDGLAEARDRTGAMPDLRKVARLCAAADLEDALDTVLDAVDRHTGHTTAADDIALILLEAAPAPTQQPAPVPRQEQGAADPEAPSAVGQ